MKKTLFSVVVKALKIFRVDELLTLFYAKAPKIVRASTFYASEKKYGGMKESTFEVKGKKIKFSTEDSYSRLWLYMRFGKGRLHEESVTDLIVSNLKSCKCFVDVGAHLGYYTLLASMLMPKGTIYSFEMDKVSYELLEKNLKLNDCKNVSSYNAAVTDYEGTVSYQGDKNSPNPALSLNVDKEKAKTKQMIEVQGITLDKFFQDKKIVPDVIKIDVEGAELKVLGGMKKLLDNNIRLFVEIHPLRLLSRYQSSANTVVSMLIDKNYDVFEIKNKKDDSGNVILRKLNKNDKLFRNTMLYAHKKEESI